MSLLMRKRKIYITVMYRWGNDDNHSYIVYVGFSKNKAIDAEAIQRDYRGGKYKGRVYECEPESNMVGSNFQSSAVFKIVKDLSAQN